MRGNFTITLDSAKFLITLDEEHQFKTNPRNRKLLSFRVTLSHILNFFLRTNNGQIKYLVGVCFLKFLGIDTKVHNKNVFETSF